MEQRDFDRELEIISAVREEMIKAEQYLLCWNASWRESFGDAYLTKEDYIRYQTDYELENADIQKLFNMTNFNKDKGLPLATLTLANNYHADAFEVVWSSLVTNNAIRRLHFYNNGTIELDKTALKSKKSDKINYFAKYNVTSDDFKISFTINKASGRPLTETVSVEVTGNIAVRKYNDIEIIEDLNSGFKKIRIVKEHDKENNASVEMEIMVDAEEQFQAANAQVKTHKGNGKINGTYRLEISRSNGVSANFISRKGVKLDLANNPLLLRSVGSLLLPAPENNDQLNGNKVVSSFTSSAEESIINNMNQKEIRFDNSSFNMEAIIEAERRILELLRQTRGEVPVCGLVERIEGYLKSVDRKKEIQDGSVIKLRISE